MIKVWEVILCFTHVPDYMATIRQVVIETWNGILLREWGFFVTLEERKVMAATLVTKVILYVGQQVDCLNIRWHM